MSFFLNPNKCKIPHHIYYLLLSDIYFPAIPGVRHSDELHCSYLGGEQGLMKILLMVLCGSKELFYMAIMPGPMVQAKTARGFNADANVTL